MYACLSVCLCLGARCSSVVECPLVVRWVVGSILHGGPIEKFLVAASAPKTLVCIILSVGYLAANK